MATLHPWGMTQSDYLDAVTNGGHYSERGHAILDAAQAKARVFYRNVRDVTGWPEPEASQMLALEDEREAHWAMEAEAREYAMSLLKLQLEGTGEEYRWEWGRINLEAPETHESCVEWALRQGQAVPDAVLADYPYLAGLAARGIKPWRLTPPEGHPKRQQWLDFLDYSADFITSRRADIASQEARIKRCRSPHSPIAASAKDAIASLESKIAYQETQITVAQKMLARAAAEDAAGPVAVPEMDFARKNDTDF